jgi:glycosyltransferase involved in cell wall biosynthesis
MSRPPVVMTFHMDALPVDWKGWLLSLHRLFIQPLLVRKMERVFVSSLDYARQSSLRSWFASHPERVLELPFGVDTDFFSPGPKTRERFSLPESCPVMTFVGGMDTAHAFKGVEELLSAFALLHGDAHLLLVGDGDRRTAHEERARALGVASRTHFLGRVDRETLRDAYRTADLFAFPSTSGAEAFGLVALEAQACGVPGSRSRFILAGIADNRAK